MVKIQHELSPTINGYRYLTVVIVAIFLDTIFHFFSVRKFNAIRANNGKNVFGFIPQLGVYYSSLESRGPFEKASKYYCSNGWLVGALNAGLLALIVISLADLILYTIECKLNSKSKKG